MITEPMLAVKADLKLLQFPTLGTPKLDGIRSVTREPELPRMKCNAVSRKFKPIQNKYIREWVEEFLPPNLDGELVVMNGDKIATFQKCSSGIMGRDGTPDFRFCVFDYLKDNPATPYVQRMIHLESLRLPSSRVIKILPVVLNNLEELETYEAEQLALGYEGVMLRKPDGPYKMGRSTLMEGWLLKVKRFVDTEGTIVACIEGKSNQNVVEMDPFGRIKRSMVSTNMKPMGILGAFVLKPLDCGAPTVEDFQFVKDNAHRLQAALNNHPYLYSVGTGFDANERIDFWNRRDRMVLQLVKVRSQPTGVLIKPRFPSYMGIRHPDDL